ncbi:bis(5'-nucleosyl)-tetraphosphatase PrpE [Terrilactibacillus sp. BCM23-1]|uniref:Bis(5'-nucleosyl)-tetraphosphatase PrpE n=1 Tax=Terrilactibacillus tamarindi TaxID=2599694 RepID=A0A6N8CNZ9_9BACI|nr:bis(5'-nucleosyl)-tetraphosphatase PrpE [Terrilactibacillus tamarindi]MTT30585.1 bis(5'-nucleosyl)-tetraphosphatase PrpE [Terrilactibacillus tamarindi]
MKFDIIGDIHGCYDELIHLLKAMGYVWENNVFKHPDRRKIVFVGDITDRGPASLNCIRLVYDLVQSEKAIYVPGNHCNKLYRYLIGRNVQIKHGLETTVAELENLNPRERKIVSHSFRMLYETAPLYTVLDEQRLIVCHAGIREDMIGKTSKKVESFVLYGDITGQKDINGLPERRDWAKSYTGKALIVYGHTPVSEPRWKNNTVNIDTGCVFGGKLTALRYPERETISIPSEQPLLKEKFRSFPD